MNYLLQSSSSSGFSERVISSMLISAHFGRSLNCAISSFVPSLPRLLLNSTILAAVSSAKVLQLLKVGVSFKRLVTMGISERRYSLSFTRSEVTGKMGVFVNCLSLSVRRAAAGADPGNMMTGFSLGSGGVAPEFFSDHALFISDHALFL